jgi:hypothetical protein
MGLVAELDGEDVLSNMAEMSRALFLVAAAIVSLVLIRDVQGQSKQVVSTVKERPSWQQETLKTWAERDATAAFEQLEASGPPEVVAQRYGALAQHLFNDRQDLPGMILAARAGIQFNLQRAKGLDATDEKSAANYRGHAKTIAYNLGANCWPGWMDQGITITVTERVIGLDAARLNLRLAVELRRPPEPLGHAHWLLGAQLLAAGQFDAAAAEFAKSAQQFADAAKPTEEKMALSYEKLTRRIQNAGDAKHHESFKQSLAILQSLDNDDARFFVDQIRTAEKAFAK